MEIIEIPGFLSDQECKEYQEFVLSFKRTQKIITNSEICQRFFDKHKEKLLSLGFSKIYNEVTIGSSKSPIGKHIDKKMNDSTHKIFMYINEIEEGGGTFFYDGEISIKHEKGKAIIFDITKAHCGEKSKGLKMTIGFRLKK